MEGEAARGAEPVTVNTVGEVARRALRVATPTENKVARRVKQVATTMESEVACGAKRVAMTTGGGVVLGVERASWIPGVGVLRRKQVAVEIDTHAARGPQEKGTSEIDGCDVGVVNTLELYGTIQGSMKRINIQMS